MPGRIIEFERRPDFYYSCACDRYRDGEYPEALSLLLKAVAQDGHRGDYLLKLADTYARLSLTAQSSFTLTKALLYGCSPDRALYVLGQDLFEDGNTERARAVLSVSRDPDAERLLDDICLSEELSTPYKRAQRRPTYWRLKGCENLEKGEWTMAVRCFKKYTELAKTDPAGKLLLAKALACAGNCAEAVSLAEQTAAEGIKGSRLNVLYAQTLSEAGMHEKAQKLLMSFRPDPGDTSGTVNCIYALAAENMHARIHEVALESVRAGELCITILHALSVSALQLGHDRTEISCGWEKILALDPGEPTAEYLLRMLREGGLDPSETDYIFALPYGCRKDLYAAAAAEAEPVACIRLLSGSEGDALYALSVLASRGDDLSVRLIGIAASRPDFPDKVRAEAARLLQASGKTVKDLKRLMRACLPSCRELLPRTDARNAKIMEDAGYNYADADNAARLWDKFLRAGGKTVSSNADAACAALICADFATRGLRPDYRRLMDEYKLRPRQLKRVLRPLYRINGITEDVDNAF